MQSKGDYVVGGKEKLLTMKALEDEHWQAALSLKLPLRPSAELLQLAVDELLDGLHQFWMPDYPYEPDKVEGACAYVQGVADRLKEIVRAWPAAAERGYKEEMARPPKDDDPEIPF
jgi:hypothetical protein